MKLSDRFKKTVSGLLLIIGVISAAFTAYIAPLSGLVFDATSNSEFVESAKYLFIDLMFAHAFLVAASVIAFLVLAFKNKVTAAFIFSCIPAVNLCIIALLSQVVTL